ncbi:MAG: Peptidase [Candidatus Saccharibacteria bacterium]|nr:Peptidase [Candidatus Saccharibacteria bacterium]
MEPEQTKGRVKKRGGMGNVLRVLVAAIIFLIGVNVGNGRINVDFGHKKQAETGLPAQLDYSGVNEVYKALKANYDGKLTASQLQDGLKHGVATATKDPYTVYFTAKEYKDFNNQLNNSFAGIGARLSKDSDGNLIIGEAIDGFPAQKAGLQARDIIATVNGTDTGGITLDDAISKIRGPAGSKVTLQIIRDKSQTLNFTIARQNITLPSVTTKTLDGNIGYIKIGTFANDTSAAAKKAADQFKSQGVKGIVLDLRDDPGGLLDSAVDVSSLWVPQGKTILQEKRGSVVDKTYYAQGGDTLKGIPTVVLVNAGSASASEITTGALHDNKAAYVIGEKSYGKGVVQQLICINSEASVKSSSADDSGLAAATCSADVLKVTVASWYRPNGQNINHKGITPDQTVKISDADAKAGNDTQLQAAQAYLNK